MRYVVWMTTITLFCSCNRPSEPKGEEKAAPAKGPMREIARWSPKGKKSVPAKPAKAPGPPVARPAPAPRTDLPPPIKGKIPALELGALKKESAREVVAKLIEAHYDAERLGLRELKFKLDYASKRKDTSTKGEGGWKSGGAPTVALTSIVQSGKTLKPETKLHQQMFQAMTYRMRRLLDGLGNGFLSRRLHDLKKLDGEVEKKGKRLELRFALKDEAGSKMTLVVGERYQVERIERTSPKGVVRAMQYEYQLEGGRNLMRSARMMVRFADNTKIPQKARVKLTAANNTLFQISYKKVGRFFVPTHLHKTMPASGDEISLGLSYSAALP